MEKLREQYYFKLKKLLVENELIATAKIKEVEERAYIKYYTEYLEYLSKYKEFGKFWVEFGNHIDKLAKVYCTTFAMWQKEFDIEDENYEKLFTAINFYILGCLIDYILDEGSRSVSKKVALEKINWNKVECYYDGKKYLEKKDVVDIFYYYMCQGLDYLRNTNKEEYEIIKNNIKLALESEMYISTNPLFEGGDNEKYELLTDKSVSFVKASFGMACFEVKDKERFAICMEATSKAFWLVDDLCDVFIDVKDNTRNSILCQNFFDDMEIEKALEHLYSNLEKYVFELKTCMNNLQEYLSKECYEYMLSIVCEWDVQIIENM